jgi:hypothetical protein
MKPVVFVLVLVLTSHVASAQSRSSANVIQKGGAPNLTSLLVGLVPAEPLELTGAVDSNSPAVWDLVGGQETMVVLISFAGRTSRAFGILDAPESTFVCNTNNRYFVGGVGDLSVVLDRSGQFLYVFFSQYGRTAVEQGVGVARLMWGDRDKPVGKLDVWSSGVWLPLSGTQVDNATPIFLSSRLWHDADADVDAYWGPTVHWNEYLQRYVMLLNRSEDESFTQEGIYVSMSPSLDTPSSWAPPTKIMDGGQWYPQVIGTEQGAGTDKFAGHEARFFMSGRSSYIIRFNRADGGASR